MCKVFNYNYIEEGMWLCTGLWMKGGVRSLSGNDEAAPVGDFLNECCVFHRAVVSIKRERQEPRERAREWARAWVCWAWNGTVCVYVLMRIKWVNKLGK